MQDFTVHQIITIKERVKRICPFSREVAPVKCLQTKDKLFNWRSGHPAGEPIVAEVLPRHIPVFEMRTKTSECSPRHQNYRKCRSRMTRPSSRTARTRSKRALTPRTARLLSQSPRRGRGQPCAVTLTHRHREDISTRARDYAEREQQVMCPNVLDISQPSN